MTRPNIGDKYRSVLSGRSVRVKEVVGDIIRLLIDGNLTHVHVRDFNAEFRLVKQQREVNR